VEAGINEKAAGLDVVVDSLAARRAWRNPALAPWLYVTAFRRFCSEQRGSACLGAGICGAPAACAA